MKKNTFLDPNWKAETSSFQNMCGMLYFQFLIMLETGKEEYVSNSSNLQILISLSDFANSGGPWPIWGNGK